MNNNHDKITTEDINELCDEAFMLIKKGWLSYLVWACIGQAFVMGVFSIVRLPPLDLAIFSFFYPLLFGAVAHSVVKRKGPFDAFNIVFDNVGIALKASWPMFKYWLKICLFLIPVIVIIVFIVQFQEVDPDKDTFSPMPVSNFFKLIYYATPILYGPICIILSELMSFAMIIITAKTWGVYNFKTTTFLKVAGNKIWYKVARSKAYKLNLLFWGISLPTLMIPNEYVTEIVIIAIAFCINFTTAWSFTFLYLLAARLMGKSTKIEEKVKETVQQAIGSQA